jgi:hypothetical protein
MLLTANGQKSLQLTAEQRSEGGKEATQTDVRKNSVPGRRNGVGKGLESRTQGSRWTSKEASVSGTKQTKGRASGRRWMRQVARNHERISTYSLGRVLNQWADLCSQ